MRRAGTAEPTAVWRVASLGRKGLYRSFMVPKVCVALDSEAMARSGFVLAMTTGRTRTFNFLHIPPILT